jgi:hypothetical protein
MSGQKQPAFVAPIEVSTPQVPALADGHVYIGEACTIPRCVFTTAQGSEMCKETNAQADIT